MYPVALLLILVPLADLALRASPPQFGSLQWRFGIVGLLLGNFGTILLGLGLVGLLAVFNGHRTVLRVLGYLALVLGIVTLALLAFFLLDALQMRQLANTNVKRAILLSSGGALFTGLFGVVALVSVGRGAIAASRDGSALTRRPRPAGAPLVVASRSEV
jgi:hypothetical protein